MRPLVQAPLLPFLTHPQKPRNNKKFNKGKKLNNIKIAFLFIKRLMQESEKVNQRIREKMFNTYISQFHNI
jgi:hypothetical protein